MAQETPRSLEQEVVMALMLCAWGDPGTSRPGLRYSEIILTLNEVERELSRVSEYGDPNPDYVYVLRQTIAVLKDLKKFL